MTGTSTRWTAARAGHLARRLAGSLSRRPPSAQDEVWARGHLLPAEDRLWGSLSAVDRRHAVMVARRFEALRPTATRAEMAGALLHDVGKLDSGLGTVGRVVATVVGPRGTRLRRYHDHERIGAELLVAGGSDPATVELVLGCGPAAPALAAADEL